MALSALAKYPKNTLLDHWDIENPKSNGLLRALQCRGTDPGEEDDDAVRPRAAGLDRTSWS